MASLVTTTIAGSLTTSAAINDDWIASFANTSASGWGTFLKGGGANNGDYSLLIRNQADTDLLKIMGDGAATFSGTVKLTRASGDAQLFLTASGTGNSTVDFNNATTGSLADIYANNAKSLIFRTNGATTTLTLAGDQSATFSGAVAIKGTSGGSQKALDFSTTNLSGGTTSNYWIYAASNQYWRQDGSIKIPSSFICGDIASGAATFSGAVSAPSLRAGLIASGLITGDYSDYTVPDESAADTTRYGWTSYGNNTVAVTSGQIVITRVDSSLGAYRYFRSASPYHLTSDLIVDEYYTVTIKLKHSGASTPSVRVFDGAAYLSGFATLTTSLATYTTTFQAKHATDAFIVFYDLSNNDTITVDDLTLNGAATFGNLEATGAATFSGSANGVGVTLSDGWLELYNANVLQLYSTPTTAGANYETFALDKPDAGNARLRVYKSGTGTYRGMEFQTGGSARLTISAAGAATFSGALTVSGTATFSDDLYLGVNENIHWGGNYSFITGSGANNTGYLKFYTSDTLRLTIAGDGAATFAAGLNATGDVVITGKYLSSVDGERLQIGSTANGRGAVVGSKVYLPGGTTSNLDYSAYWAYDAYFDNSTRTWKSMRTTLGRKWKMEAGYHIAQMKFSFSSASDPISWSDLLILDNTGAIQFNSYGSGTHTGTSAYKLSVDSSGNIIETSIGAGAVDGSGTAGYISKWTDSDTIGNSIIYASATSVGISSVAFNSPAGTLHTQAVGGNITYLDTYSTTNGTGSMLNFRKSDNNTAGTKTQTDSGDSLGTIGFYGVHSESDWGLGAGINVSQEGVSGTAYVPAHMAFATCTASAYVEHMRITSAGLVGIGTNAPSAKLTILENTASDKTIILANNTAASGRYSSIVSQHSATDHSFESSIRFIKERTGVNSGSSIGFLTELDAAAKSLDYRLYIQNGNVGIGTTEPNAKLEVVGTIRMGTGSYMLGEATSGIRLNNSADTLNLIVARNDGDVHMPGRLAIGTSTLAAGKWLTVVGTADFSDLITGSNGISITGSSSFQGADFSSALTGTSAAFSGNITGGGTAIFTGDMTIADDFYFKATNAWIIAGSVAGGALTGGTLRIQNFGELEVDGVLDVNGAGTSTFASDISSPAFWYRPSASAVHCWQPKDGYYHAGGNVHTGAIRIKLPPIHDAMITFWVDVYDYRDNENFSIYVGGYPYASPNPTWSYTSAVIIGGLDRNFTVRFGDNNLTGSSTEYYVYIGETDSEWNHPQVVVRDVFSGYDTSASDWEGGDAGFGVSFATSFENVAKTQSNTLPYGDYNKLINTPTLSFLPLSGGTLTGALHGTLATFSGNMGIGTNDPGTYALKVEGTTWLNDQVFIAGNNTAPPTSSNSQDFGAIRMSGGGSRSMYQGCTDTYGWVQVMSSTNHATNYPLALNPNGGKVGIATATPNYKLEVRGTDNNQRLGIQPNTATAKRMHLAYNSYLSSNTNWYGSYAGSTGMITFYEEGVYQTNVGGIGFNIDRITSDNTAVGVNPAPKMIITTDSKVGIGTAAPATPLHVWSTSYPQFRVSYNSSLYFTLDHAATLNVYGNDWYVRLNGSEKFRIKQDGKIGIGTNNPLNLLTLRQAAGANIRFENATTGRYFIVGEGVGANDKFSFRGNSYRSTDTLTVDFTNNRVGVANISPGYTLDVNGTFKVESDATFDGSVYVRNANNNAILLGKGTRWGYSSGYKAIQIGDASGTYTVCIGYDPAGNANGSFTGDGGELLFRNNMTFMTPNAADNGWHPCMHFQDGNVKIGSGAAGYKLDVGGTFRAVGILYANSTSFFTGATSHTANINMASGTPYITFYGDSSSNHAIGSRNASGNADDDIRINSYGAVIVNLDSNGNNSSGADFNITRHGGTGAISASDYLFTVEETTGNVGIGTTSPANKLHVYGSSSYLLGVEQTAATWTASIKNTNAIGYGLSIDTSNDTGSAVYNLACYTGTNSGFFVTNQGRVGIGVTAPATKLEVSSGSVRLTDNYAIEWGGTKAKIVGSNAGDYLKFYTDDTPRICVISDGKVGIGTITPTCQLEVQKFFAAASGTAILRITSRHSGSYTGASQLEFAYNDSGNVNVPNLLATINALSSVTSSTNVGGILTFSTKALGGATTALPVARMTIRHDGNVGIGTTAPTQLLEIYKAGNDTQMLVQAYGGTDNSTQAGVWFRTDNSSAGSYARSKGAVIFRRTGSYGVGNLYLCVQSDGNSSSAAVGDAKLTIIQDGNVGIGTTAPAATLHVRDTTASTSRWTAAFVADNAAIVSAQAHDHVLIQSNDVPSLKLYEYGQDQVGGIAVGDNNCTIASTETLRFYVNGSATDNIYNGLAGTRALLLSTSGAATFVGSVTAVSFSGNGASISALNALNISAGTVGTARLGSGTANSSTFLAGNNTWATPSNTTYSAGTGLTLSSTTFSTKLDELTDMTADVVGSQDELILLDNGSDRRKQINEIKLGQFNNDQGWTSNAGTVTSVTAGTGMTQSGTSSINPTLNVIGGLGITANANDIALNLNELVDSNKIAAGDKVAFVDINASSQSAICEVSDIPLSVFDNDSGWTSNPAVSIASSAADVLGASNGAISADDAGTDKLVFWDDSAGKLKYLTFSALAALP